MNQSNSAPMLAEPEPAGYENINLWSGNRRRLHRDSRLTIPEGQGEYQWNGMSHSDVITPASDMLDVRLVERGNRWLIGLLPRRHVQADTEGGVDALRDLLLESDTWAPWKGYDSQMGMLPVPVVESDRFRVREQLEDMKVLKAGWADGHDHGKSLSQEGLDWLADQMEAYYSNDLPHPYLYPMPRGDVQIEWHIGLFVPSLEIDLCNRTGEWHCVNLHTHDESEKELDLAVVCDWLWVVGELQRLEAQTI